MTNEKKVVTANADDLADLIASLLEVDERLPDKPWCQCVTERPELLQELEQLDTTTRPKVEFLLEQYIAANPHYEYPPTGDRHPAMLIVGPANQWLTDAFGGVDSYVEAIFDAAKVWFAQPDQNLWQQFNLFNWHFQSAGAMGYSGNSRYQALFEEYLTWTRERRGWFPTPPEVLAEHGLARNGSVIEPVFPLPKAGCDLGRTLTNGADWEKR